MSSLQTGSMATAKAGSAGATKDGAYMPGRAFSTSEVTMNEDCAHLEGIREETPSALGCEECLRTGSP
jgi:hypothetical protein